MNATEIRIGNYYIHNGDIKRVTANTINEVWEAERTWCKPIPLTEEILFKCGFELMKDHFYRLGTSSIIEIGFFDSGVLVTTQSVCLNHIKHLHQLQNLYFCLCGNELTVNL